MTTPTKPRIRVEHRPWDWECHAPGLREPTVWPTWHRAMDEAKWHAEKRRHLLTVRPLWQLRRRLRALQAQGWTAEWIGKHLGVRPSTVDAWCADNTIHLTSPTESRRIVALFDWVEQHTGGRIRDTGPTPAALANSWATSTAWDDIDDPAEHPRTGFSARSRKQSRARITVPDEVLDRLRTAIDAHHDRAVILSPGDHKVYDMGIRIVAEQVGIEAKTIRSLLRGCRATLSAENLDRLMIRLGMIPAGAAA